MSRFKDFGSPTEADNLENLTFKLYGEDFVCYPDMPGKVLLEFVSKSDSDRTSESAEAISGFFKKVLLPESFERFDELASDPNRIVSVATLAEIVGWILETYSNRPTQGSENSPAGD